MAADVGSLLADLDAESADLDALVGELPEADWRRPTPSPGWTIADQIAHLAWTDDIAALAATDPDAFQAALAGLIDGSASVDSIAAAAARAAARRVAGVVARPSRPTRCGTRSPCRRAGASRGSGRRWRPRRWRRRG